MQQVDSITGDAHGIARFRAAIRLRQRRRIEIIHVPGGDSAEHELGVVAKDHRLRADAADDGQTDELHNVRGVEVVEDLDVDTLAAEAIGSVDYEYIVAAATS